MNKKHVIILAIGFIGLIVIGSFFKSEKLLNNNEKLPVKVGTITIGENQITGNFTSMGEMFAAQESTIVSKTISNVKNVNVKIGDKVVKGQSLILLSSNAIETTYLNAKTNYDNALNTLNRTISSSDRSIKSAEISLKNANITYENTKKQVELQKNQALQGFSSTKLSTNLSIDQYQQNLDSLYLTTAKSESSARTNLSNVLSSAKVTIYDVLGDIDEILGIEEVNKEGATVYQSYLGTLNPSTLSAAKNNYRLAKNAASNTNFNDTDQVLETLNKVYDSVFANLELLKNSSTGPNFSTSSLNSLIESTNTLASTVQTSITSVSSSKKTLDSTITSNQASIDAAKKALELAKQQNGNDSQAIVGAQSAYDVTIQSLESALDSAKNNLDLSKSSYESVRESARLQISQARSQVDIAKGQYESAKVNYDDLNIKAPFDGEVSNIFVELGNEISTGKPVIELKNNNSSLKIVTYLNKSQIAGLNIGDEVGIGTKSKDKISSISGGVDGKTKKFKLEILHDNPFLKTGQFVELKFTKKQNEKVINTGDEKIFVPLSSVFVTSEGNYVWILDENNSTKKSDISLGEISGSDIEIVSGLKNGDIVITKGARSLNKEGEKIEIIND